MLDITYSMRNLKQGIKTTYLRDIYGIVFVKLRGLNVENPNFYTQLPLNEDENNFDKQFNDINYKITIRKLHDAGRKNIYFISADVSMLLYGYGVSHYPQFYDRALDMYQVLPHPYMGSFDGFPGDFFIKNGC